MNCRTCKYNRYEPVLESGELEEGMINNCYQPDLSTVDTSGVYNYTLAHEIEDWMGGIHWDAEGLCPEVTEPCPGHEPNT